MSNINTTSARIEPPAAFHAGSTRVIGVLRELLLVGVMPLAILLVLILHTTKDHFTYSFDDPYIHLSLARNIWLGHYGLNLAEASAPSSSIIWPFLLAPFASMPGLFEYVPLAVNAACLIATIYVIGRTFDDIRPVYRTALVGVIAFVVNAYGLVFTGMEHSLQLLLTAIVLRPHLRRTDFPASDVRLPWYIFVALVLLPLVRYEDCAIAIPLLLLAALRRQRRAAAISLGLIAVTIGGFSLFLHHQGLGFLPSSVIAKASVTGSLPFGWNVLLNIILTPGVLLGMVCLVTFCWRRDRAWALLIFAACVLHLMFGGSGTFGRYTAYISLFVALCGARAMIEKAYFQYGALIALLLGIPLAYATVLTPVASSNIDNQQAQMAEIARELDEPVAANDIGLIAFRGHHYLLDLYGLASSVALQARRSHADPVWMSELMKSKGVRYAIIYDIWFPKLPAAFRLVGKLTLRGIVASPASRVVSFYAIDADSAAKLKRTLVDYAARHRNGKIAVEIE